MTVTLVISGSSFGNPLGDTVDIGTDISASSSTSTQDLYISHDAEVSPITGCALYVTEYVGSNYLGSSTTDDLSTLLTWGDSGDGIKLSQDQGSSWTTIKNGTGDIDNAISLTTDAITTGTPVAGQIPVDGEAHLQVKVDVPSSPGSAGYRAFSFVMEYSATS